MSWKPFRPRDALLRISIPMLVALGSCVAALAAMMHFAGPGPGVTPGIPTITRPLPDLVDRAAEAESVMRRAQDFISQAKAAAGVQTGIATGPDPTGLIGEELTPLVTTLGSLEAKRLAADPRWARVLTTRLNQAGVGRDDVVAASFSGSFPGLNLAVTAACQALGANLIAVSSVTASTWGANQPGFTWPEIERRLVDAGLIRPASVAVSVGGAADRAADLEPEGRELAERIAAETARGLGVPVLRATNLAAAISARMALYEREAGGRCIVLFVNVGGNETSLGTSSRVLRLRSGFVPGVPFDFSAGRGVMARLADRGVPLLNLLNVRDLGLRWGVR